MINLVQTDKYIGNPYGYILPLAISGKMDGAFEYEVYDSFYPLISDMLTDRIEDYLTDGFYRRVMNALSDRAKECGYVCDPSLCRSFILHYRAPDLPAAALVRDDTVRVDDINTYTDLTETDFDTDEFPAFATIVGGRIVSICGVNGFIEENTVEIAVETADPFGGRGYGSSNAAAMTRYLQGMGYEVAYMCYPDNTVSSALAERVGFTLYSRDYNFVCYEAEE